MWLIIYFCYNNIWITYFSETPPDFDNIWDDGSFWVIILVLVMWNIDYKG